MWELFVEYKLLINDSEWPANTMTISFFEHRGKIIGAFAHRLPLPAFPFGSSVWIICLADLVGRKGDGGPSRRSGVFLRAELALVLICWSHSGSSLSCLDSLSFWVSFWNSGWQTGTWQSHPLSKTSLVPCWQWTYLSPRVSAHRWKFLKLYQSGQY